MRSTVVMRSELKFSILQLLEFTAAFCLMFACCSWSVVLAAATCPFTFGLLAVRASSPHLSAWIHGLWASFTLTAFTVFLVSPFAVNFYYSGLESVGVTLALGVSVLTSIYGGVRGARNSDAASTFRDA